MIWVGQGRTLYGYTYIVDFLHEHMGHNLIFVRDNDAFELEEEGYLELEFEGVLPNEKLSPSEAVYGILAFLSTRSKPITVSAKHDASILADIANDFCKANNLADPREDYHKILIHPKEK